MDFGYLGCILVLIICMIDISDHNKKVEKLFPDDSDQHHWHMRSELHVPLYGFGFLLVLLIGLFIRTCFH